MHVFDQLSTAFYFSISTINLGMCEFVLGV